MKGNIFLWQNGGAYGIANLSRDEAGKMLEAVGRQKYPAVFLKRPISLIAGESAGSKLTKAQELGIRIIDSEAELLQLLNGVRRMKTRLQHILIIRRRESGGRRSL